MYMHPICSVPLRTIANILLNKIFILTTEFSFTSHNNSDKHLEHRYYMVFNKIKLLSFLRILHELIEKTPALSLGSAPRSRFPTRKNLSESKATQERAAGEMETDTHTPGSVEMNSNAPNPVLLDASANPGLLGE